MAEEGEGAERREETAEKDAEAARVALLEAAIEAEDPNAAKAALAELHPADAAAIIDQLPADDLRGLARLTPDAFTPDTLTELDDDAREIAVEELPPSQIAAAVAELDSDDAALLVDSLPDEMREGVLAGLAMEDRLIVEEGLAFEEETVGRLMQREFVAAPEFWTVGDAIDHMRAAGEDELPEAFYEIYVVDPGIRPIGAVTLSTLMRMRRERKLSEIMVPPQVRITPEMDQEDAAYAFRKYNLAQAPVVDEAGRLKGMLTIDDMVDVMAEESEEDLLALGGVSEASVSSTTLEQVRARAPWLHIHLLIALASSFVISLFEGSIERLVALAILMPMVSALGGSAGMQSLAVTVSALASRQLTDANARRTVMREIATAILNGLILAVAVSLVSYVWFRDPLISAVIACALTLNILWGGVLGIVVPLALKRLGVDPAVASNVFVAAAADITGFALFLGLATIVLL